MTLYNDLILLFISSSVSQAPLLHLNVPLYRSYRQYYV